MTEREQRKQIRELADAVSRKKTGQFSLEVANCMTVSAILTSMTDAQRCAVIAALQRRLDGVEE